MMAATICFLCSSIFLAVLGFAPSKESFFALWVVFLVALIVAFASIIYSLSFRKETRDSKPSENSEKGNNPAPSIPMQ